MPARLPRDEMRKTPFVHQPHGRPAEHLGEAVRQPGLYWLVLNEPPPATGGPAGAA